MSDNGVCLVVNMDTVAVVRSEDGGEGQLQVAGVAEECDDVCQGKLEFLLRDVDICWPLNVAGFASFKHILGVCQAMVSTKKSCRCRT